MTTLVDIPAPALDSLLRKISKAINQEETRVVIHELKGLYSILKDFFVQNDLYGALKQLYKLGAIDDDGDQKLLEILVEKTSKKDEILKLISSYKQFSSPREDDFIGRDADVSEILKLVKDRRVPGVNLFGDSGVGKTTLAKEVSKGLQSFDTVVIDLRDIKCLKTVYFHILQALHLPAWDDNRMKERIYKHLENLKTKTVLILDSIEQFLSNEIQAEKETRADFLEFLNAITGTESSKRGDLKVILTSTIKFNELQLKRKLFTEYNVQPLSTNVSKDFIRKRIRGDVSDDEQDKAMTEIADLCGNNPYRLQGAEQLIRQSFTTPADVLRKIKAHIDKEVPEHFACIRALFESLPNDHLKEVAVKISLLRHPFSVKTVMKIAEISSEHDAELDLEMLAVYKIITAENVEEKKSHQTRRKRKYNLHAMFRDFVTSHLCQEDPIYKEQLEKGKKQFFEHFSGKLTKHANHLENEFVKTYSKLEIDRANFELAIDLSEENRETLDLLLHTDDPNQFAMMGILFEVLKDVKERRDLFKKWADAAEKQEQWFTSALMRCWESIQGSDLEGKHNEDILQKAKTSIRNLQSISPKRLNEFNSLFLYCQGKIKWMKTKKLSLEEKRSEHGKKLLKEGIEHFEQSVEMRKELEGDSTLTARTLNLIGNCYMDLEDLSRAAKYYQMAMDMKLKLVGSENHWEIPTYYNQMAVVHEMLGRKEEKWYKRLISKGKARKEYEKAFEWMKKALDLQEKLEVSNTIHTAIFQRNLANILIGLKKYDDALEHAQISFDIRNTNLDKHPETVRILYLIGVIHEWRKDHEAALQSYEQAFEMEESLPEDNHSVVRKLLFDRLEVMRKKLKKKDKLEKHGESTKRKVKNEDTQVSLQYSSKDRPETTAPFSPPDVGDDNLGVAEVSINPEGGIVDIPTIGTRLHILPNTVTQATTIKYKKYTVDSIPVTFPAGKGESVVSYIVGLEPSVELNKPIFVSLMHSGLGKGYGYETIVRAFNHDNETWEEPKVLDHIQMDIPAHCRNDYVVVQISKLTILAVITRLITDRFHVTPKGCVVRSSVCGDVTVEFPEGAVDKTVEGTLKLLLVPEDVSSKYPGIFPCPVLFVDGLENCTFHKPVTVRVPHPRPDEYSAQDKLFLFRHDVDKWVDLTNDFDLLCHESYIEFKMQHFCIIWVFALSATAFVSGVVVGKIYANLLHRRRLSPNLNLSDEQNRWFVVTICLNITLLPHLRDFLKREMDKHYNDLKTKHSIDKQSHSMHLKKDGKHARLKYKSINNNETRKNNTHLYDYNVKSSVDLGKLYLEPYMVQFTGFDDTCDISAVLCILSSASIFSSGVQNCAESVRRDVRNPLSHCTFQVWTDTKFIRCFQLMKSFVQALKLPVDDEKQIMEELGGLQIISTFPPPPFPSPFLT